MRSRLTISLVLVLPSLVSGQTATGISDFNKYASPSRNWCLDDRSGPNLIVRQMVKVTGTVSDEIEKPVADANVWVRLRDPQTNHLLASTHVGTRGSFDLGMLEPGEYSLQIIDAGHGKFWRLAELDKPKDLSCSDQGFCHLDVFVWLKSIARLGNCPKNEGATN